MQTTTVKPETEIPIDNLRFYSDEKLSFCICYDIHSVRCPKHAQISITMISAKECETCRKENR